ncbi:MAG: D-alanyl-D-alanine carboxypeptidase [Alphaproteobacteria bacterium]|nr:D-alanyl-D-alanine carboxypeptidase [Alphaproteobacteria bacterium]
MPNLPNRRRYRSGVVVAMIVACGVGLWTHPVARAEDAAAGLQLAQAERPQQQRQQQQRPQQQRANQPNRPRAQQPAPQASQPQANPGAVETTARQAILIDFQTSATMFERAADERMAPSSMTKLLTLYVVFQALREGRLQMSDEMPVSERAWRMQGSKMFVMVGTRVRVDDLLRGVIVQSGNDACIVLAEGLSGSEEAFAEVMNETARRLGMANSNFRNSSGWPDVDHYSTARDLAILARHLIADFPDHYPLFNERVFAYNGITQPNRNPLIGRTPGADGLKTGHTEAAGYGLTASAIREGRRVILVVNGLASMRARAEESERLMDWAFREYANYTLLRAGAVLERADVWMGQTADVPLTVGQDLIVTLPRRSRPQMRVTAVFDQPVRAPIQQGQEIGRVLINTPGMEPVDLPLIAGADVARLGTAGRVSATIGHMIWGSARR